MYGCSEAQKDEMCISISIGNWSKQGVVDLWGEVGYWWQRKLEAVNKLNILRNSEYGEYAVEVCDS